jgi:hypothetical protein
MPYVINNTNGTKTFYIGDQTFNTETALTLPGRNVPDYGEPVDTNFIHMLENFANDTPPQATTVLTGQLWYDTSDGIFKVYDGTNWVQTGKVPVSELPPGGSQSDGNFYFDENIRKLKVYYDNQWFDSSYAGEVSTSYNTIAQGSPTLFGTRIRNIFLKRASDNRDVPVLAIVQSYDGLDTINIVNGTVNTMYGEETLIGIMSRNAEFVAQDVTTNSEEEALNFWDELNEAGGIGTTIKPGLNIRKDATAEYPIASLAQRAQTSYALNLGSYGADGGNIMAANVFHHGADSLPVSNLTYDLGGPANVFAELWVDDIYLSNALLSNGNANITIGTDNNPITNIYVTNIEVDGNLIIEGDNVEIGSNVSPVETIYVNAAYIYETLSVGNIEGDTNYVFPSSRSGNSRLVCDDDGQLYWLDNGALYNEINQDLGIRIDTFIDPYGPAGNINNRQATIGVKIGNGLDFDGNGAIEINFNDITTCDIVEGDCDNLWYSDQRVFNYLTTLVELPYETGLETRDLGTSEQLRVHGGPSRIVGTIQTPADSALQVVQNRSNRDDYGFNIVELDVQLGPIQGGDGVTGIPPGSGLVNTDGEIGLDWKAVADNLYTNDLEERINLTNEAVGEIGIARVNNPTESDQPATHVLYIKSINSLGDGELDVTDIVFKNKDNTMANNGRIQFGPSGDYFWKLGYSATADPKFNSLGTIAHRGDIKVIGGGLGGATGSVVADGDVTARRITQLSDERLKKNIAPITNGLDKVLKMQGVEYQYIADNKNLREVGLIAQQVEEVVPEVVNEDADGMKNVNYGALVGVLIEAVKELTQEVETLKAKLGD